MDVEYLVVGQGICGTLLTYEMQRAGITFHVIDEFQHSSSSRVAAGMMNPVTGRRIVKSWMVDELLPFAAARYLEMGALLNIEAIADTPIVDFFPNKQMQETFQERAHEMPEYLTEVREQSNYQPIFNYHYRYGLIKPAYTVNSRSLLPAWREWLLTNDFIRNERLDYTTLSISNDGVRYADISASKIIFCNGHEASETSWFRNLPFAANKGQALILRIPGLSGNHIYARSLKLVPLGDGLFWCGSSYEWDFTNEHPSESFREQSMQQLRDWLLIPFELVDHVAALRPATLERRPFVGFHPAFPRVGIFNGMGTKGFSLAPWFAAEFVEHLVSGSQLNPAVDVGRFRKVLSRSS